MRLFTRTVCAACAGVKDAMKRKGIEYEEVNIEKDHESAWALIDKGFRTVPVLEIDGQFIAGDELKAYAESL